mgnify:CR=1 FL=1
MGADPAEIDAADPRRAVLLLRPEGARRTGAIPCNGRSLVRKHPPQGQPQQYAQPPAPPPQEAHRYGPEDCPQVDENGNPIPF